MATPIPTFDDLSTISSIDERTDSESSYSDNVEEASNLSPESISSRVAPSLSTKEAHIEPQSKDPAKSPCTQVHSSCRPIHRDWWTEIVSFTIAASCTFASVVILLCMQNRSMQHWKLRIQPNTLVAFLATLTRAALIYPLGECIGHLKWVDFEHPRALSSINTFDEASRGPLGAIQLLLQMPSFSPLASCAAALTVLLLLFQPFLQQTIQMSSRTAVLGNETAYILRASDWTYRIMGGSRSEGDSCKLVIH